MRSPDFLRPAVTFRAAPSSSGQRRPTMQSRMKSPALILPGALETLQSLKRVTEGAGVPPATLDLVELRASQINGCGVCVDMHARAMRKAGETEDRLSTVAAWRHVP